MYKHKYIIRIILEVPTANVVYGKKIECEIHIRC